MQVLILLIQCLNVAGDLSFHFNSTMWLTRRLANAITVLLRVPMQSFCGVVPKIAIIGDVPICAPKALERKTKIDSQNIVHTSGCYNKPGYSGTSTHKLNLF